jgi:hypothetical protein
LTLLLHPVAVDAVALSPGDFVVCAADGRLAHVDPETGAQTLFSNYHPLLSNQDILSVVVNLERRVFALKTSALPLYYPGTSLVEVDPETGEAWTVSTFSDRTFDLALHPSGDLYVIGLDGVIKVDPDTGAQTTYPALLTTYPELFNGKQGTLMWIAIDQSSGKLYVGPGSGTGLYLFTPPGNLDLVSTRAAYFTDVIVDGEGGLIVADRGRGEILHIDTLDGETTIILSNIGPEGLTIAAN